MKIARQLMMGMALIAVSAAVPAAAADSPARTISVTGEGEVTSKPDLAEVILGVTNDGPTAGAALQANSQAATAMIDLLKREGVEERDLQTSGLVLQPKFEQTQNYSPPKAKGYTVSNTVTVRVRDLSKLGALLDKAVSGGANDLRGVQFDIAKRQSAQDEARRRAMQDAARKAALFAEAGGVKLGALQTVEEEGGADMPQPRMFAAKAVAAGMAVPVEAGELSVRSRVRAVYLLTAE